MVYCAYKCYVDRYGNLVEVDDVHTSYNNTKSPKDVMLLMKANNFSLSLMWLQPRGICQILHHVVLITKTVHMVKYMHVGLSGHRKGLWLTWSHIEKD